MEIEHVVPIHPHPRARLRMHHPGEQHKHFLLHSSSFIHHASDIMTHRFTLLILLVFLCTGCVSSRKHRAYTQKVDIDSLYLHAANSYMHHFSGTDIDFTMHDMYFNGDTLTHQRTIIYSYRHKDTISTQKHDSTKFALQSYQIDSVVQVSSLDVITQQSANKWHFSARLKIFTFLAFAFIIGFGVWRLKKHLYI